MILTAHQPTYLPWLGLLHKIAISDAFCNFDDVQYQKKDWNNRNKLKGPNGEFWMTVPVKSKNHFETHVGDIEIDSTQKWQRKHLKSLELNYRDAPYFTQYIDFFRDCYSRQWTRLAPLNEYILKWFLEVLGITVKYYTMSEIGFKGTKSALVLDMCQQLGATCYIFGQLGRDYADTEKFAQQGIEVHFQEYHHPVYDQLFEGFVPYLSTLDLLFNQGPHSLDIIMANNITKDQLIHGGNS